MRLSIRRRAAYLVGCSALALAWSASPVLAQDRSGGEPQAPPREVGEVVVTAQRRVENLQEVPISAQVVSGKAMAAQNINSLVDLSLTTPSVHIDTSFRVNNIYVRGIGSGPNPSFDQSVSIFVDDIYHARSRVSGATFLDLERVEILKGPQSTFFGANAIAGAIDVVTAKPGRDFSGWARALYGGYRQYAVEGATNVPLTEALFARVAVTANGQEGWLTNIATGKDGPAFDNLAGRLKLLFQPNDDFDATLKIDASKSRGNGQALQIAACPPPAPFVTSGNCTVALALGVPIGLKTDEYSLLPGQFTRLTTNDDSLTMNYHRWDHVFTSVTGYFDYDYQGSGDISAVPSRQQTSTYPERYHQFSQEFRVSSPAGNKFEYLFGLYYQSDHLTFHSQSNLFNLSSRVMSTPALAALVPYLPFGSDITASQGEEIKSVFGSLTWNVSDRLRLSAGLRGSWADKDFTWRLLYGTATQNYGGLVPLPANVAALPSLLGTGTTGTVKTSRSDHDWMPSARVQYQLAPRAMIYASYARGFKEGGFNGADNLANGLNAAQLAYDPEQVDAYEAGLKSEWFDRRVRFNLAAFLSNYDRLQVSQSKQTASGAYISIVGNNAFARTKGIEVESQWVASDALNFSANIAYIQSRYTDYDGVAPTVLQTFCSSAANKANPACVSAFGGQYLSPTQSLDGKPTPLAPKWAGNVTATYHNTFDGGIGFMAELTYSFSSSYYTNTGLDDPYLHPSGLRRLDGQLTLSLPDQRLHIDLIGKNLNDGRSYSAYNNLPSSAGSIVYTSNPPRSVAIQVRYDW